MHYLLQYQTSKTSKKTNKLQIETQKKKINTKILKKRKIKSITLFDIKHNKAKHTKSYHQQNIIKKKYLVYLLFIQVHLYHNLLHLLPSIVILVFYQTTQPLKSKKKSKFCAFVFFVLFVFFVFGHVSGGALPNTQIII